MIGLVLAAGAGRRLRPYTDSLPKALVPVDGTTTILDIALRNFAATGLTDVAVVVGYAASAVRDRAAELERVHGVTLELVENDKAEVWNNAYSLWCARDVLGAGAVLLNGDTVHPASVEQILLACHAEGAGRSDDGIVLALDTTKELGEEEMKVVLDDAGHLRRITKQMPAAEAAGEYIGATLIEPGAVPALVEALKVTYERDPQLYYEDGYQELVDRGFTVGSAPIAADTAWVEVDDHVDLERARGIACRY